MNWSNGFPRCEDLTTRAALDFGWKTGGATSVFAPIAVVNVDVEFLVDACVEEDTRVDVLDWVGAGNDNVRGVSAA